MGIVRWPGHSLSRIRVKWRLLLWKRRLWSNKEFPWDLWRKVYRNRIRDFHLWSKEIIFTTLLAFWLGNWRNLEIQVILVILVQGRKELTGRKRQFLKWRSSFKTKVLLNELKRISTNRWLKVYHQILGKLWMGGTNCLLHKSNLTVKKDVQIHKLQKSPQDLMLRISIRHNLGQHTKIERCLKIKATSMILGILELLIYPIIRPLNPKLWTERSLLFKNWKKSKCNK